jgi:hypothetical protein
MRTVTLNAPFREAAALADSTIATNLYQVALAGRGYMVRTDTNEFRWQSMDYMRPQQDSGEQAGEGSLSNLDQWRRSSRSWHLGAGQSRADEPDSQPYRFLSSKGINPWEKWRFSLLNNTQLVQPGGSALSSMVVAADQVIFQSGNILSYSADGETWNPLTTLGANPVTKMATDGENVYLGMDTGVITKVTPVGVPSTEFTLANTNVLGFSKGRLFAGALNILYFMTPGNSPTAHVTVPWTGWRWSAICEGSQATYAAGALGDKSAIYRIPIKADGTGLDAGVVAASLPDGEIVTALSSYLGYIMIGTSKGVRFATPDTNGDLAYGALIPTDGDVLCFEPQDRFIWFGWSNYDGDSTGLGRVDLTSFTSTLTPAYASDLMYSGQGDVTSVVTFAGKQMFSVRFSGVVRPLDTLVSQGVLTASEVTYDLDDDKVVSMLDVRHEPLSGIVSLAISSNNTGFGTVAESSKQGSTKPPSALSINPITGHRFSLQLTLTPNADSTLGPIVRSFLIFGHPLPARGEQFYLPLEIAEQVELGGAYKPYDPPEEVQFLRNLVKRGTPVTLQIGAEAFNVYPANYRWVPYRQTQDKKGWSGTCIMELREVTR